MSNVEIIKLIKLLSENNELKTNDLFIQFYGCNEATIICEIAEELELEKNGYLPNSGAQYDTFSNTFGASLFTYNLATRVHSTTATSKNIKISGMSHNMKEYVRMINPKNVNIVVSLFAATVNIDELFASQFLFVFLSLFFEWCLFLLHSLFCFCHAFLSLVFLFSLCLDIHELLFLVDVHVFLVVVNLFLFFCLVSFVVFLCCSIVLFVYSFTYDCY